MDARSLSQQGKSEGVDRLRRLSESLARREPRNASLHLRLSRPLARVCGRDPVLLQLTIGMLESVRVSAVVAPRSRGSSWPRRSRRSRRSRRLLPLACAVRTSDERAEGLARVDGRPAPEGSGAGGGAWSGRRSARFPERGDGSITLRGASAFPLAIVQPLRRGWPSRHFVARRSATVGLPPRPHPRSGVVARGGASSARPPLFFRFSRRLSAEM